MFAVAEQTQTVQSRDPVTILVPSGEMDTASTASSCPVNPTAFPWFSASHIVTWSSSPLTIHFPSRETVILSMSPLASLGCPTSFPSFTRQCRTFSLSPPTIWSLLPTNATGPAPTLRLITPPPQRPRRRLRFHSTLASSPVIQLSYFNLVQLIPLLRDYYVPKAGLSTLLVSVSHPPIALCTPKTVTAGWQS